MLGRNNTSAVCLDIYTFEHLKLKNMNRIFILGLTVLLSSARTEGAKCEDEWFAYKDELCIKIFSTRLANYAEAKAFCLSQGSEISNASLVMVKDPVMENLLVDQTANIYDNVWLGGKYDAEIGKFLWDDGEQLSYSDWQEGYPRNASNSEVCVEFKPVNTKQLNDTGGRWADVTCQKRNMVMCQKVLSWTLQDAIDEIISIRKKLADSDTERDKLKEEVETIKRNFTEELQSVSSKVVPVGSIYIEYSNQPSPSTLWPSLRWQDISSTYAGLFFRASGGGSEGWGTTQGECAPRIAQLQYWDQGEQPFEGHPNPVDIAASGWSNYMHIANHWKYSDRGYGRDAIRLNTQSCEVRPKNQAIRIWKRTA